MYDEFYPGELVAVSVQAYGRREGIVLGSHFDPIGRHYVEVRFDQGDCYNAWYPTVTRVRRTTYYLPPVQRTTTVERRIYW
ncbi:hypothetical protein BU17DRAFT_88732 [Hysterangium stoloniferum]|nr:hypothetical protein BU17DRAFT_88732 [Hysterangium stoloniferum]